MFQSFRNVLRQLFGLPPQLCPDNVTVIDDEEFIVCSFTGVFGRIAVRNSIPTTYVAIGRYQLQIIGELETWEQLYDPALQCVVHVYRVCLLPYRLSNKGEIIPHVCVPTNRFNM